MADQFGVLIFKVRFQVLGMLAKVATVDHLFGPASDFSGFAKVRRKRFFCERQFLGKSRIENGEDGVAVGGILWHQASVARKRLRMLAVYERHLQWNFGGKCMVEKKGETPKNRPKSLSCQ